MKRKAKRKQPLPLISIFIFVAIAVASVVSVFSLQERRTVVSKAETNCPGKLDVTGACNPACCDPADSKTCPDGEVCSIQNGYCKGGYSCNPAANKVKRDCIQNICAWVSCKPDDPTCCDTDKDPKCMYCDSNEKCVGVNVTPSPTPEPPQPIPNDQRSNSCFNLSADVESKKDQSGYSFYPSLKVESPPNGKDGHIQLFVNGASKGTMIGWNKRVHNPYVLGPNLTGTQHVDSGQVTVNYAVKIDECDKLGNYLNLTCRYSVHAGKPTVEGPSCTCTNCTQEQPASSSSSSRSSSSASAAKTEAPPATQTMNVVFSYVLGTVSRTFIAGGVCLEGTGVEKKCEQVDVSKNEQTVSFVIDQKNKSRYSKVNGYLIDNTYHVYQAGTGVNLETKTSYAIKINIGGTTAL